jgi:hypothetical protein
MIVQFMLILTLKISYPLQNQKNTEEPKFSSFFTTKNLTFAPFLK